MKFLTFLVALALINNTHAECKQTGAQIMEKQKSSQSAQSEQEDQEIVIVDAKTNNKESRKLKRYSIETDSKNRKSILYFSEPSNIKGAGLLNWKNGAEENQWLYLPELKKLQRIASGSRKNYFMGTDFTYADLEGENLDKNSYSCQQIVKCQSGKSQCYVIEAKPINDAEARNIGYSKRMLLIDKDDLITLKVVFFDLAGSKLKTATYANWTQIGSLWRPDLAIMERAGEQKTFIKVNSRKLNKKIDDVIFTKRFLKKEMHIK